MEYKVIIMLTKIHNGIVGYTVCVEANSEDEARELTTSALERGGFDLENDILSMAFELSN